MFDRSFFITPRIIHTFGPTSDNTQACNKIYQELYWYYGKTTKLKLYLAMNSTSVDFSKWAM